MRNLRSFACCAFVVCSIFLSNVHSDISIAIVDAQPSKSTITEEVDPYSYFFDRSTEQEASEDNDERNVKDTLQVYSGLTENQCKGNKNTQEEIFYKRLVTLLLSSMSIKTDNNIITGTVHIEASDVEIKTLQKFINGKVVSLREVDRILSNIIRTPPLHIVDVAEHFSNKLYMFLTENREMSLAVLSVIIILILFKKIIWSRKVVIVLAIDIIIVISFFITWYQLIQEAEIKAMAAQAQFSEVPVGCQPHKMGLWDKMVSFFSTANNCEKYYEAMFANPKLQVTPALAMSRLVSTVILHPLERFGHVIATFIDSATSNLSWPLRIPITIILFINVCILVIVLPFCLTGGSLSFSLGPLFRFSLSGNKSKNVEYQTKNEQRKPIELIEKSQLQNDDRTNAMLSLEHHNWNSSSLPNAKLEEIDSDTKSSQKLIDLGSGDTSSNISVKMHEKQSLNTDKCENDQAEKNGSGDS